MKMWSLFEWIVYNNDANQNLVRIFHSVYVEYAIYEVSITTVDIIKIRLFSLLGSG